MENTEIKNFFQPNDLSNIFINIHHKKSDKVDVYDFAWDITHNGILKGELFYSSELKEWWFIKDNYPIPRKTYRINFPIKDIDLFITLFKNIKIELIKYI